MTHAVFPVERVYNGVCACLIDPVRLKVGTYIETIRFIVVPRITEPMVLGMVW